jgi:hypothetical protein
MHICMHTCILTCVQTDVLGLDACMHTYIHTYTHTYIHTYTHTHAQALRNRQAYGLAQDACKHTCIHTYMHTYIHTHTHTHRRCTTGKHMGSPKTHAHEKTPHVWQYVHAKAACHSSQIPTVRPRAGSNACTETSCTAFHR